MKVQLVLRRRYKNMNNNRCYCFTIWMIKIDQRVIHCLWRDDGLRCTLLIQFSLTYTCNTQVWPNHYADCAYFLPWTGLPFLFLKWANPSLFFVYFRLFQHDKNQYKLIKVLMVCLGLEPRAARWNVQTNPLCYADDSNRFVQPFAVLLTRHHYADVWSLQSSSQRVK